jgi:hypothetical protein
MSEYERLQIESLLQPKPAQLKRGTGLFVMPDSEWAEEVYQIAVRPALRKNEIDVSDSVVVFDTDSMLADVARYVQTIEVIVVDLTALQSELMYVLGLCLGLGRCPILIAEKAGPVPFNLQALRCVEYAATRDGLFELRENLARAIRTFLLASRVRS